MPSAEEFVVCEALFKNGHYSMPKKICKPTTYNRCVKLQASRNSDEHKVFWIQNDGLPLSIQNACWMFAPEDE